MDDPGVAVNRREAQMASREHRPLHRGAGQPAMTWQAIATSLLCVAGLGLSLYTLWVHCHPGALACIDAGPVDCQAVLTSPQSVVAGVPVPYFGVTFFVILGVLCLPASRPHGARRIAGSIGVGWPSPSLASDRPSISSRSNCSG